MNDSSSLFLRAGTCSVLLSLMILALARCGGDYSPPRPPLPSHFALLRTPSHPPSRLMAARMRGGSIRSLRAHSASTVNGPISLIVGRFGEVCLFAEHPFANSCTSASYALQHGMTVGVVEHPAEPSKRVFVLYGVVPDGEPSVTIQIGSRPPGTVHVHQGAFSIRAREPVVKIR